MASQILTALKQKVSGLELEPSTGGCFELTVDGKLIYSKLDTGEFPEEGEMVSKISDLAR